MGDPYPPGAVAPRGHSGSQAHLHDLRSSAGGVRIQFGEGSVELDDAIGLSAVGVRNSGGEVRHRFGRVGPVVRK